MSEQLEEIDLVRLGTSRFHEMCQLLLEAEYGEQFVSGSALGRAVGDLFSQLLCL